MPRGVYERRSIPVNTRGEEVTEASAGFDGVVDHFELPHPPGSVIPEGHAELYDVIKSVEELRRWCDQVFLQYKEATTLFNDARESTQAAIRQKNSIEEEYIRVSNYAAQLAADFVSVTERMDALEIILARVIESFNQLAVYKPTSEKKKGKKR